MSKSASSPSGDLEMTPPTSHATLTAPPATGSHYTNASADSLFPPRVESSSTDHSPLLATHSLFTKNGVKLEENDASLVQHSLSLQIDAQDLLDVKKINENNMSSSSPASPSSFGNHNVVATQNTLSINATSSSASSASSSTSSSTSSALTDTPTDPLWSTSSWLRLSAPTREVDYYNYFDPFPAQSSKLFVERHRKHELHATWSWSRFFCGGFFHAGPEWKNAVGSLLMIVIPTGLFLAFPAWDLWDRLRYGWIYFLIPAVLLFFSIWFHLQTAFADPGILPRNMKLQEDEKTSHKLGFNTRPRYFPTVYSGQQILLKYCETCSIHRPPRTVHCAICNNCVEVFDHHCPWLGTCIGRQNYRTFHLFLYFLTVMLLYGLGVTIYHQYIISTDYYEMRHNREGNSSYSRLDSYRDTLHRNPISFLIMLYCVFAAILVISLKIFHLQLMARGETTNERLKDLFKLEGSPFHLGCCKNWCSVMGKAWKSLLRPRALVTELFPPLRKAVKRPRIKLVTLDSMRQMDRIPPELIAVDKHKEREDILKAEEKKEYEAREKVRREEHEKRRREAEAEEEKKSQSSQPAPVTPAVETSSNPEEAKATTGAADATVSTTVIAADAPSTISEAEVVVTVTAPSEQEAVTTTTTTTSTTAAVVVPEDSTPRTPTKDALHVTETIAPPSASKPNDHTHHMTEDEVKEENHTVTSTTSAAADAATDAATTTSTDIVIPPVDVSSMSEAAEVLPEDDIPPVKKPEKSPILGPNANSSFEESDVTQL